MRKVKRYARGAALIAVTIMAAYLIFCGVGVTDLPEWDGSWLPVQICMFCVGGSWLYLFCYANGAFDEYEEEEEE